MNILAFDLSSGRGTVAWSGRQEESFEFANDRKHSGAFFEHVELCLARFGKPDRIAVGLGPGSYAGTRIAIATAIGLQVATGAELVGLPSVCAMETEAREYIVVGDARRNSFFSARVADGHCIDGPKLCTRDELVAQLGTARCPIFASEDIAGVLPIARAYPSARVLARLAREVSTHPRNEPLEPIYLRPPHITQPKPHTAALLNPR